jgi:hypothetical protein
MVTAEVMLPRDLLEELDRRVGVERRNATIVQLVEKYVEQKQHQPHDQEGLDSIAGLAPRKRLTHEFIREFAGSMRLEDYPDWDTREDIARWVHDERRRSDRSLVEPSE